METTRFHPPPGIAAPPTHTFSGNQRANNFAMDIRQPKIAPGVPECQRLMVNTHQREHRCMEIMDVDFLVDAVKTILVGHPVTRPRTHTTPAIHMVKACG